MKWIPKNNLHFMVPFDRHPHTNTMVGRRLKTDCNRKAAGTQLIGTDVFSLPVLSTLQQWLLYIPSLSSCTLPQGKLTLWSIINYKFFPIIFLAQQPSVGHGLLIHELSRLHTTTHHSRQDSSGRVINSSQRPVPHNTQPSTLSVGFEHTISAGERPHNYALDRATTGTGL